MAQPKNQPRVPCFKCGRPVARSHVTRHAKTAQCRANRAWNAARAHEVKAAHDGLVRAGHWTQLLRNAGVKVVTRKGSVRYAGARTVTRDGLTKKEHDFEPTDIYFAPVGAVEAAKATKHMANSELRYAVIRRAAKLQDDEVAVLQLAGGKALVALLEQKALAEVGRIVAEGIHTAARNAVGKEGSP